MYQDYSGNYDTSSRGSSTSPAQPESFTSGSSTIGSPISTSNYQPGPTVALLWKSGVRLTQSYRKRLWPPCADRLVSGGRCFTSVGLIVLFKYRVDMPGSNSAFIPTINAITTSQDLQWMVQPTVITSMSNPYSRSHPYGHHLTNGPGLLSHNTLARPGVIRSTGDLRRRKREEQKEIESLQKEKDKLEFMLVAHNPVCKLPIEEHHQQPSHQQQQQCNPLQLTMRHSMNARAQMNQVVVKQEPEDREDEVGKPQRSVIKPICLGGGISSGMYCPDGDSLNTPVVVTSTPAATPNTQNLIFTYPNMMEPESPSPSSESCSKAHRRSSSSGDQSSDSLNSPTLLAL
ncbi:hypothetical protein GOODEAATRI_001621 [Goodea atripinnis]|uniref:Fos-related antigen 2 n=1 Tax=Goodea atripinnis TaxID=208336 RepID=A0ABV0PUW9_9TELE